MRFLTACARKAGCWAPPPRLPGLLPAALLSPGLPPALPQHTPGNILTSCQRDVSFQLENNFGCKAVASYPHEAHFPLKTLFGAAASPQVPLLTFHTGKKVLSQYSTQIHWQNLHMVSSVLLFRDIIQQGNSACIWSAEQNQGEASCIWQTKRHLGADKLLNMWQYSRLWQECERRAGW